jgi:hypothetical protein
MACSDRESLCEELNTMTEGHRFHPTDLTIGVLWDKVRDLQTDGRLGRAERRWARGYLRQERAKFLKQQADRLSKRLATERENTGGRRRDPELVEIDRLRVKAWRAEAALHAARGARDQEQAEEVFDDLSDGAEFLPLYVWLLRVCDG